MRKGRFSMIFRGRKEATSYQFIIMMLIVMIIGIDSMMFVFQCYNFDLLLGNNSNVHSLCSICTLIFSITYTLHRNPLFFCPQNCSTLMSRLNHVTISAILSDLPMELLHDSLPDSLPLLAVLYHKVSQPRDYIRHLVWPSDGTSTRQFAGQSAASGCSLPQGKSTFELRGDKTSK